MAHIQTSYLGLWKPQDLAIDRISSQKMFVDNINTIEEFGTSILRIISAPVASIDDLRAINTSDTNIYRDGKTIVVGPAWAAIMYRFSRSSDATDNGDNVIAPTTGGGRWISLGGDVDVGEEVIEFSRPSMLTNLYSGDTLSESMGKLAVAVTDLMTHVANKDNPHTVTASQINALSDNFSNVAVSTEDALMNALDNAMNGMGDRTIKVIGITFITKCGLFPQGARTIMTIHNVGSGYGYITAFVCDKDLPKIIIRSWALGVYSEWIDITNPVANTVAEAYVTE